MEGEEEEDGAMEEEGVGQEPVAMSVATAMSPSSGRSVKRRGTTGSV